MELPHMSSDAATHTGSGRHPTVDHERAARGERAFIAGKIQDERRDLAGFAEPPHRLTFDKTLPGVLRGSAEGGDTLLQRGRAYRSGAHRVAAYIASGVIARNRFRQTDHRRLARPIGEAIAYALD